MFENYSEYEKEKVRLFLKYLAHASNRHIKKQNREKELLKAFAPEVFTQKQVYKKIHYKDILKFRLDEISEDRRKELENKIDMHYTNNKFLPYENKLKKLKAKYSRLKKKKNTSKTKLNHVKNKITKCDSLLKELKTSTLKISQISRH